MSRSTQYIGLNERAEAFLKNNKSKKLCDYQGDTGMFDEPMYYGIYEVKVKFQDHSFSYPDEDGKETNVFENTETKTFVEVTQCAPWSSGPCYFTYLKNILTGEEIGKWKDDEIWKIA